MCPWSSCIPPNASNPCPSTGFWPTRTSSSERPTERGRPSPVPYRSPAARGGSTSACAARGTGSPQSIAMRRRTPRMALAPTVYGAYHRRGERIALQYWLFYPLNPYSPEVPSNPLFAQVHEGDWEVVTVILDRGGRPLTAAYSRHCSGAQRVWARVPKRGARPVVYVALGSHANYFGPGAFRLDERCWPEQAVIVFENYGKPLRDFTGAGRTIAPRLARVTAASPRWMRFPGDLGRAPGRLLSSSDVHVPAPARRGLRSRRSGGLRSACRSAGRRVEHVALDNRRAV